MESCVMINKKKIKIFCIALALASVSAPGLQTGDLSGHVETEKGGQLW